MKTARIYTTAFLPILLSACGGGNSAMPTPSANYDLQAGIKQMVSSGLSSNVALSGTATVNGASTPFTGSGTLMRPPASAATFNGTAASSQITTVAGTISVAGQSTPYSTSVTDYYAASDGAFLGEVSSSEFDVAQAPILFPTSVVGGSSGILGTLSRYADSTMSVSLGTVQISYSVVLAPVDPGSPIGIAVTTKIYDTQNTIVETDITNYTMTSGAVISFSGASAQNQSGMLTVTAN